MDCQITCCNRQVFNWCIKSDLHSQQICLALAPVFFSATCYVVFGVLITILGTEQSRLKPRSYALFFVIADVLCIILQGIGGECLNNKFIASIEQDCRRHERGRSWQWYFSDHRKKHLPSWYLISTLQYVHQEIPCTNCAR